MQAKNPGSTPEQVRAWRERARLEVAISHLMRELVSRKKDGSPAYSDHKLLLVHAALREVINDD